MLLEALLRGTATDPEHARHLANAIGEWVGSAPAPRPQNVLLADYGAAGLDYGPPGCAARDAQRTWQGSRHDSSHPCSHPAPSHAVWAARTKRCHHRSVCRGGTRSGRASRTSALPGTAAPGHSDDSDYGNRVRLAHRPSDPVCRRPYWSRATPWLPNARLERRFLMLVGTSLQRRNKLR
jgi:hypothetical protein